MSAKKQNRTDPDNPDFSTDESTEKSEVIPLKKSRDLRSIERIIEGAIRVFSRRPADLASVQMIADEAGVKVPLLIYHFKNKENLYREVFDRVMKLMAQHARPYFEILKRRENISTEAAVKMLYELIDVTMDGHYDERHPGGCYQRILYFQLLYRSDYDDFLYQNYTDWIFTLWTDIIKIIIKKQDHQQAVFLAVSLFGMMNSFHFERKLIENSLGWKHLSPESIVKLKAVVLQNFFWILDRESPERGIVEMFHSIVPKRFHNAAETIELSRPEEFHEPDDSLESVKRIIEASLRLYQNRPFDAISLKEVAKESGIALPLIVHHFKNRNNLHRTAFERILELHMEHTTPLIKRWDLLREKNKEEAMGLWLSWVEYVVDTVYGRETASQRQELALFHEVLIHSDVYESYFDRFYKMFFQSHYEKMAGLITIISGETDRETITLRATSVFGMILSAHIEQYALKRFAGMECFSKEEVEQIKAYTTRYAKWIAKQS